MKDIDKKTWRGGMHFLGDRCGGGSRTWVAQQNGTAFVDEERARVVVGAVD